MKSRQEQAADILSANRKQNLKSLDDIIACISQKSSSTSSSSVKPPHKRKVRRIFVEALAVGQQVVAEAAADGAETEYSCRQKGCSMRFECEEELVLHNCCFCTYEGCGKRLCSHAHLIDHYRVHSNEMPFECPWEGCTKKFKWKRAISEHLRVHTRERPFSCDDCGKTYRYAADLREHKQKKHPDDPP